MPAETAAGDVVGDAQRDESIHVVDLAHVSRFDNIVLLSLPLLVPVPPQQQVSAEMIQSS